MTQRAYPLDDTDYYAEDVRLFHVGRTSGIFNVTADDLRVKANGGMKVGITPGYAFLLTADKGVGGITYGNTEEVVFTVDTASTTLRYDYISVRYSKSTNSCELTYVKGTGTKPTYAVRGASQYEIILAIIQVPANAESIQARDIIDTRLDENLCGLTIDGMIKLPTDGMNSQFLDFMKFIQDKLGEDEGGKLLQMIQTLEERVANLENRQEIKYKIGVAEPNTTNCPPGYFYFQLEG